MLTIQVQWPENGWLRSMVHVIFDFSSNGSGVAKNIVKELRGARCLGLQRCTIFFKASKETILHKD